MHFVDVRDLRDIIRDLCDICLKLLFRHKPLFVYLQFSTVALCDHSGGI